MNCTKRRQIINNYYDINICVVVAGRTVIHVSMKINLS